MRRWSEEESERGREAASERVESRGREGGRECRTEREGGGGEGQEASIIFKWQEGESEPQRLSFLTVPRQEYSHCRAFQPLSCFPDPAPFSHCFSGQYCSPPPASGRYWPITGPSLFHAYLPNVRQQSRSRLLRVGPVAANP